MIKLKRSTLTGILLALYGMVFIFSENLNFPLRKDENHFWPTSMSFSQTWVPTVEKLRSYNELNTPLPFVVFGWLERAFHGGVAVGRGFNLAVSFLLLLVVSFAGGAPPLMAARLMLGLLTFPYYLGTSTHLYTDMLAVSLGVAGWVLHRRGQHWLGAGLAVLAISSRQYMVALPLSLVLWEGMTRWKLSHPVSRLLPPLLAMASLGGWILFFEGPAPRVALNAQGITPGGLFPSHGLYFLSCVGAYYVVVEWFLGVNPGWVDVRRPRVILPALLVLLLFFVFPPWQNPPPIPTMGFLDVGLHRLFPNVVRVIVLAGLALLAVWRFAQVGPAGWVIVSHMLILMKAPIAWDKYALSALAVLWFLRGCEERGPVSARAV